MSVGRVFSEPFTIRDRLHRWIEDPADRTRSVWYAMTAANCRFAFRLTGISPPPFIGMPVQADTRPALAPARTVPAVPDPPLHVPLRGTFAASVCAT